MNDTYAPVREKSRPSLLEQLNQDVPKKDFRDDGLNGFVWALDEFGRPRLKDGPEKQWFENTLLPWDERDKYTFENFNIDEGNRDAYLRVSKWDPENESVGLFILGPSGTGKTHLLKALIRKHATNKQKYVFAPAVELIKPLLNEPTPENEALIIGKYVAPHGLIIDDIQEVKETDYQNNILKKLLDQRASLEKPTFMTCDLTVNEVREHFHRRVLDRIRGYCDAVETKGTSHRVLQKRSKLEGK